MRISTLLLATLVACEVEDSPSNAGSTSDPNSGNGLEEIPVGDSDTAEVPDPGVISGLVTVSLYNYDAGGELIWTDWDVAYPDGNFPFGAIFVGAYALDEESLSLSFLDQYVIRSPDVEGNRYSLQVDPALAPTVRVYAMLDYWGDGILATNEPMGIWPDTITVESGVEVSDVNVDIPAPYYDFDQGGGGGGVWNPDDWVELSGAALITQAYAGGSCVAMMYDTAGVGPYYVDAFTPLKNDAGAEGDYSMWLPKNWGDVKLLGAWDSNYNGLIDPADTWGQYVDDVGAAANPITVADKDLPDHTLMLPYGATNPSLVPFVVVSGDLSMDTPFADLAAGATVYVAALKYRPDTDVSVADLTTAAYDVQSFTGAELTGDTLPYALVAPANTIVYLWAYVDVDGDGRINEVGEAVASYGSDASGHLATGITSHSGVDLLMQAVTK